MRKWKLFIQLVFVFVFMAGCSTTSESEGVVTLTFWDFHTQAEQEFFKDLVDEYNSMQNNVKIEYFAFNQSDYSTTKLPVAFANNEGPDIFMTSPGDFQKYAEVGLLADLTPYFSEELKEDFVPSALEAVTDSGKILALPYEMELLGLYYNKTMLEEADVEVPETWDELRVAAEKLKTDKVAGLVLPTDKGPYLNFVWYPFLWQKGGNVLNEEGTKSTFNTPEAAVALDYWGSFYQKGLAPSKLRYAPTEIANLGNETAAMQIVGTWAIPVIERDYSHVDIGVAPIPKPEDGKAATAAGGWKLAANARGEHVEEAVKFIMWAFGDDPSRPLKWVTETKFAYPPRQSVLKEAEAYYDKGLRKVFTDDIYNSAIPEPKYNSQTVDAVGEALHHVMFGNMSGEEAAKLADQKIRKALSRKR